jgi:hypothetical protein
MSWGPIIASGSVATIQANLVLALQQFQANNPDCNPIGNSLAQLQSCMNAAGGIAGQGVVGANPEITITGHATPNYAPGSSNNTPNCTITITITDQS